MKTNLGVSFMIRRFPTIYQAGARMSSTPIYPNYSDPIPGVSSSGRISTSPLIQNSRMNFFFGSTRVSIAASTLTRLTRSWVARIHRFIFRRSSQEAASVEYPLLLRLKGHDVYLFCYLASPNTFMSLDSIIPQIELSLPKSLESVLR